MNDNGNWFMNSIEKFENCVSKRTSKNVELTNRTLQILLKFNDVENYRFDGKHQYEALHEYFLSFYHFLATGKDKNGLPVVEAERQSLLLKNYLRYLWLYDGEARVISTRFNTLIKDVRRDVESLHSQKDFYTAMQDRLLSGTKLRKFLLLYTYSFDENKTVIENPTWEHIINPFGDYKTESRKEPDKWHNIGNFMIIEWRYNISEKKSEYSECIIKKKKTAFLKSKSKEANTFTSSYPGFFAIDYFALTEHKADFDQRRQHIIDYLVKYLCE